MDTVTEGRPGAADLLPPCPCDRGVSDEGELDAKTLKPGNGLPHFINSASFLISSAHPPPSLFTVSIRVHLISSLYTHCNLFSSYTCFYYLYLPFIAVPIFSLSMYLLSFHPFNLYSSFFYHLYLPSFTSSPLSHCHSPFPLPRSSFRVLPREITALLPLVNRELSTKPQTSGKKNG